MRTKYGITLMETVTVLAILLLVAAILTPVYTSAKRSVLVTATISNLKQVYLSTEIYRGDNDGSPYGNAFEMGLPPSPIADALPIFRQLKPPLAPHPVSGMLGDSYWHYYLDPDVDGLVPSWSDYTRKYAGSSVIYADPFFNPSDVPLDRGDLYERYVIGISLDGGIRRKRDRGDWMMRSWWHDRVP